MEFFSLNVLTQLREEEEGKIMLKRAALQIETK